MCISTPPKNPTPQNPKSEGWKYVCVWYIHMHIYCRWQKLRPLLAYLGEKGRARMATQEGTFTTKYMCICIYIHIYIYVYIYISISLSLSLSLALSLSLNSKPLYVNSLSSWRWRSLGLFALVNRFVGPKYYNNKCIWAPKP